MTLKPTEPGASSETVVDSRHGNCIHFHAGCLDLVFYYK